MGKRTTGILLSAIIFFLFASSCGRTSGENALPTFSQTVTDETPLKSTTSFSAPDGTSTPTSQIVASPTPRPTRTATPTPRIAAEWVPEGAIVRMGRGSINDIGVSPDGDFLAVGGSIGVFVYRMDSLAEVWFSAVDPSLGSTLSIAWSPDGKILATGFQSGKIILWSAATGEPERQLEGFTYGAIDLEWSPDGSTLAACSHDGSLFFWDASYNKKKTVYSSDQNPVPWTSLKWSPDGSVLAVGSLVGEIHLLDGSTGQQITTFTKGPYGSIDDLAWSPVGKYLAFGLDVAPFDWGGQTPDPNMEYRDVIVLDATSLQVDRILRGHTDHITGVIWSADGKTLASASRDGTVVFWNSENGHKLRTLTTPSPALRIAWSADGAGLAAGTADAILFWNAVTGERLPSLEGFSQGIYSVSWSPDGKTIATGSKSGLLLWDTLTGGRLRQFTGQTGSVETAVWSPKGNTLAAGSSDGGVTLWDGVSGARVRTLKGHGDSVTRLAWSGDGGRLASAALDDKVILWNSVNGGIIRILRPIAEDDVEDLRIADLAWSPDGKILATVSNYSEYYSGLPSPKSARIQLWDAESGSLIRTISDANISMHRIAWSPDGSMIATGNQYNSVTLWDVASGSLFCDLPFNGTIYGIAWSPDSGVLAAGSSSGQIAVWFGDFSADARILKGHMETVASLGFSSDGKLLASGSWDGTIILWDMNGG